MFYETVPRRYGEYVERKIEIQAYTQSSPDLNEEMEKFIGGNKMKVSESEDKISKIKRELRLISKNQDYQNRQGTSVIDRNADRIARVDSLAR